MEDETSWTPNPEDNKLSLIDKDLINEFEAKGIALDEYFVFQLDSDIKISTQLILEIHRIAFSELYDWAGKWRTNNVVVGHLIAPDKEQVLQLMYQFIDNLNFKIDNSKELSTHLNCLTFAHYEFVRIHPFNNGNGRTGRILMNLIALKFGYKPLELYQREGESRKIYISAMRSADQGNFFGLSSLIGKELIPF